MRFDDMKLIAVPEIEPIQIWLFSLINWRRVFYAVVVDLILLFLLKRKLPIKVLPDALVDLVQVIAGAELVKAEEALCAWWLQGRMLQPVAILLVELQLIARALQKREELLAGHAGGDGAVDVFTDHAAIGRLSIFLRSIFSIVFTSTRWVLYY